MSDLNTDVLPNCICKNIKNVVFKQGPNGLEAWIPLSCANCPAEGGYVRQQDHDYAFYLCNKCVEKWGVPAGCVAVPDEVFWEKVKQAQLEELGREMTAEEVIEALKDDNHFLSKLVKDRYRR